MKSDPSAETTPGSAASTRTPKVALVTDKPNPHDERDFVGQPGAQDDRVQSPRPKVHAPSTWIVVKGTVPVFRGNEIPAGREPVCYAPPGIMHGLANPGKIPLKIIEVQSCACQGEDDIVRFEDCHGRVAA